LVMLAKSFMDARRQGGYKEWASAISKGGVLSGLVLTTSAVVSGPVWVGLVCGILLAILVEQIGEGEKASKLIEEIIANFKKAVSTGMRESRFSVSH
jgi:hypothetical protein